MTVNVWRILLNGWSGYTAAGATRLGCVKEPIVAIPIGVVAQRGEGRTRAIGIELKADGSYWSRGLGGRELDAGNLPDGIHGVP